MKPSAFGHGEHPAPPPKRIVHEGSPLDFPFAWVFKILHRIKYQFPGSEHKDKWPRWL